MRLWCGGFKLISKHTHTHLHRTRIYALALAAELHGHERSYVVMRKRTLVAQASSACPGDRTSIMHVYVIIYRSNELFAHTHASNV